jgi:hypothetical protein
LTQGEITVLEMTEVLPQTNEVSFFNLCNPFASKLYGFENAIYEVDLFKDFYVLNNYVFYKN